MQSLRDLQNLIVSKCLTYYLSWYGYNVVARFFPIYLGKQNYWKEVKTQLLTQFFKYLNAFSNTLNLHGGLHDISFLQ